MILHILAMGRRFVSFSAEMTVPLSASQTYDALQFVFSGESAYALTVPPLTDKQQAVAKAKVINFFILSVCTVFEKLHVSYRIFPIG